MTDMPYDPSQNQARHMSNPQYIPAMEQRSIDEDHDHDHEQEGQHEVEVEGEGEGEQGSSSILEFDDSLPLVEPHQSLDSFLESFWGRQMGVVERDNPDFRTYPLPLARIKKVMKSDEEVKVGPISHATSTSR